MKKYKIIKATNGVFAGISFETNDLKCSDLSEALNRKVEKTKIERIDEGLYRYRNSNYTLIIKEVN